MRQHFECGLLDADDGNPYWCPQWPPLPPQNYQIDNFVAITATFLPGLPACAISHELPYRKKLNFPTLLQNKISLLQKIRNKILPMLSYYQDAIMQA